MTNIHQKTKPDNTVVHQMLVQAVSLHNQGQLGNAGRIYRNILSLNQNHFDAKRLLGTLLHRLGDIDEGVTLLKQALSLNSRDESVHCNLGNAFLDLKRFEDALDCYRKALKLKRDFAEAYYGRSLALTALGKLDEALVSCDKAISLRRDYADAYNARGNILKAQRKNVDALSSYDQALSLTPTFQDALNNRGVVLEEMGQLEEALNCYVSALQIDSASPDILVNLGAVLSKMGHHDQALSACEHAIAMNPRHSDAILLRGCLRLLLGDFSSGWIDLGQRFFKSTDPIKQWFTEIPDWNGEDIRGKNIVIFEEQGIGDIIQFLRYVPLVASFGSNVTLVVRKRIQRLIKDEFVGVHFIENALDLNFHFKCALMSLPYTLKTTRDTIPACERYLSAEVPLIEKWKHRLGEAGIKVAVAWQGNPQYRDDILRSIPLKCFAPLARVSGVRLISLQKNFGLEQLADLPPDMHVETLNNEFDEGPDAFIDTAAIMSSVDLIITSDTSIAHLAGALGRPTWLALTHVPDWRWMLDREDSPWYPTMRLYRQVTRGDWISVFERMAVDLAVLAGIAR